MSKLTCKEEFYFYEEWKDVRVGLADGTEVKVDRTILGEQCKFSAKMLKRGAFKEGITGFIDMSQYEPSAVRALTKLLYFDDYFPEDDLEIPEMLHFHVEVYGFAKFIMAAVLAEKSREKIMEILKQSWEEVLSVLPATLGDLYDTTNGPDLLDLEHDLLEFALEHQDIILEGQINAEMMELAHKFMGKFLKEIARQNNEKEEKLCEAERRIRSIEARYKWTFKQQKSRIRSLKAQVPVKETYRCPRCENIIELVMPERQAPVACYRCRASRVPTSWKRYLRD